MWYVLIALGVILLFLIPYLIIKTNAAQRDKQQMEKDVPIILANNKKIEEELKQRGFESSYSVSSFGYKFFEYKTKYHAPDNLNLQIDAQRNEIACYMLLPYDFKVYAFNDLVKYDLLVNNGQIDTKTLTLATGTSIGGVGIGVGSTDGTSKQRVNSIGVMLYFDNGDAFGINFLNNIYCYQGDERYVGAIMEANKLTIQLDKILSKKTQ